MRTLCYKMKRRIALLLSIVMILGMSLQASAADKVGSLADCYIGVSVGQDGIILSVDTFSTTYADEIGCRDVVLNETYNGVTRSIPIQGGSTSGYSYVGSLTYKEAKQGASYSASCVHYAKWGSTEQTLSNSTDSLVYN